MSRNRHKLDRDDIDLEQLADELGAELGRRVAVSARMPADSPAGEDGLLLVVDDKGEELDVPSATVQAVIRKHKPRQAEPAPDLLAGLRSAETVAELRAALLVLLAD